MGICESKKPNPIIEKFKDSYGLNETFKKNICELKSSNISDIHHEINGKDNNLDDKKEDYEKFNKITLFRKIIDFSDIQTADININLIHYDKNIKNQEHFEYYKYLSLKIKGNYCPFDNYDMLKLFLSRQSQIPFSPNYMLMISDN